MSLLTSQTNGVEIYQLLAGRDFCKRSDSGQPRSGISQMAAGMSNYVYCIHDSITNQALLIDPCWDVDGIFNTLAQLNITNIETCAYTHHHFDHTGGHLPAAYTGGQAGVVLPGIAEVLLQPGVQKVCAGALDIDKIIHQCRIPRNTITPLLDGDPVFETAHVVVKAMHTPGHTAGSMTFVACNKTSKSTMGEPRIIVTGDTLFIGSCGRYDLPDSNVRHMLMSLEKLSALPSDCIVCPGHNYALPSQTTIGQEKLTNQMMQQAMEVGPQLRNQELQRNTTCGGGSGGSGGGGSTHRSSTNDNSSSNSSTTRGGRRRRSKAMSSFVPLPDYLGVARHLLKSHIQWEVVHNALRCEECCTLPLDNKQYEPSESLL